ncbi:sulfurtransferase [Orrella marina]|uniref:tRNA uridine(34) hydroxylase n=1 Tax=Orrella marina TaxID=2163011 RepID=A0A2R4XKS4_9BURK|nr:sulfurtransferase [Orrella marina]AWB34364.1 sulfurtransferase [Orrella marina]
MSQSVLNIAAYRFTPLSDLPLWKERFLMRTRELDLRGTILVAHEGINLFLAGTEQAVNDFVTWLREIEPFAEIEVKYSWSDTVPFKRMKIKIKNEIIRMNHPSVHPFEGRAPSVDSHTALRWIRQGQDDEGRPVMLLDTRNEFEIEAGTFKGAQHWHLDRFTQFPEAVHDHYDEIRDKTVISFCTGGIRCEKAALYMNEVGLDHVYQLEGGILKYFEETGGAEFEGTCFVFDERETLDPGLHPKPIVAHEESETGVDKADKADKT